jgi:citrate lyase gamma subunit
MNINKSLSLNGQVILNINNTDVQVMFLNANLDLDRKIINTSKQTVNNTLVESNIEEVQKQVDEFNLEVKNQATINGFSVI